MSVRDSSYLVEDLEALNGEGLRMRSLPFGLDLEASNSRMIQLVLPGSGALRAGFGML